ncbi:MAG: 16S rRNA (cytosine(1402)-N(4))-methyltransferase RsmH [Hyphomicrobiales bacterium]|nr:16S rRNA (cytosine(1402)-N(4))-methyltransferase RsmH [Hyphomicrobiales bacterium]
MGEPARHDPVMLDEVLALLMPRRGAIVVDATFGGGGYSRALLQSAPCQVIALDRDPDARARAHEIIGENPERFTLLQGCFGDAVDLLDACGVRRIDGIAFDLGVSSFQLGDAGRGFSFQLEGPLDMRMDPTSGRSAAELVNALGEKDLAGILFEYGEERASRRIAAAIVRARDMAPILTTARLAEIVRSVLPRGAQGIDPATRTFQALRVFVNDELGELERGLRAAEQLLVPGGRLVVVAFHSLEDRRVKSFLKRRGGEAGAPSRHQPFVEGSTPNPSFSVLTRRAIRPSAAEVARNPRARSARLRAGERTSAAPWPERENNRRAA